MSNFTIILLFILLVLTGCATSRGALTYAVPDDVKATCPKGRYVYLPMVEVTTIWDTEEQEIEYSWQCTSNTNGMDTYRTSKILGTRIPEPPPKQPHEFHGKNSL